MNIDFVEAKKELENIFKHTETHRKIVFWYDEGKNFFDAVQQNAFPHPETIIFDNNPFKIGDLLDIPCFNKEGKWILDNNTGKWARSSTQFEDILNNYKIIEE